MNNDKRALLNVEIKLDDTRKTTRMRATPEMLIRPDYEQYLLKNVISELFDKSEVTWDILGQAEYLLQLTREGVDSNMIAYEARLYMADIKPRPVVEMPAWWEYSETSRSTSLGTPVIQYKCTHCGNVADRAYRFCPHCGKHMEGVLK